MTEISQSQVYSNAESPDFSGAISLHNGCGTPTTCQRNWLIKYKIPQDQTQIFLLPEDRWYSNMRVVRTIINLVNYLLNSE